MIVDIRDQLGNQFFTYAATKCIALETGQRFRWFSNGTSIVNSFDKKLGNTLDGGAFPNIDLSERILPIENPTYTWIEPWPRNTNYLEEVYNFEENDIVRGHFQCSRYFEAHRENVLHWYTLSNEVQSKAKEKFEKMKAHYSGCVFVSVHFRRGWDYLREGRLLDEGYYIKAVQRLCQMQNISAERVVLILFSDVEISSRFAKKLGTRCEKATGTLFEDLAFMMLCDHHIISNSTFAWWGAWLDQKNAVVIRPSIYPISAKEYYPDNIFPENWCAVEAHRVSRPIIVFLKKLQVKFKRIVGKNL